MDNDNQTYHVLIRFEAQQEIQEAYQWYESKARKVAKDFLLALDERFTTIERDPTAYPVIYKQVRRALLRRFPYGLYYFIEGEVVIVLACFHASRDPRQWQRRIDDPDNK